MSVDAALPLRFVAFASQILVAPPTIGVALYLIYRYVGVSTFTGLAFLCISVPLSGFIVKSLFRLRFAALRKADMRVKLTNEVRGGGFALLLAATRHALRRCGGPTIDPPLPFLPRAGFGWNPRAQNLRLGAAAGGAHQRHPGRGAASYREGGVRHAGAAGR
jgi:hypothetical protein